MRRERIGSKNKSIKVEIIWFTTIHSPLFLDPKRRKQEKSKIETVGVALAGLPLFYSCRKVWSKAGGYFASSSFASLA